MAHTLFCLAWLVSRMRQTRDGGAGGFGKQSTILRRTIEDILLVGSNIQCGTQIHNRPPLETPGLFGALGSFGASENLFRDSDGSERRAVCSRRALRPKAKLTALIKPQKHALVSPFQA